MLYLSPDGAVEGPDDERKAGRVASRPLPDELPAHLGSMLGSQFSAKNWRVFFKKQCYNSIFAKISSIFFKKTLIFSQTFWRNIFKIITYVGPCTDKRGQANNKWSLCGQRFRFFKLTRPGLG
jgi:hypothetical protein